mgnify:CR=1 FL=1
MDGHVQHDGFGRDINYLRIAVTDKCNFRCIYCMPADGVAPRAHDELLSAEEIARFVRLVAGEGIRRVRLTGGEPLVSRRIIPWLASTRRWLGALNPLRSTALWCADSTRMWRPLHA